MEITEAEVLQILQELSDRGLVKRMEDQRGWTRRVQMDEGTGRCPPFLYHVCYFFFASFCYLMALYRPFFYLKSHSINTGVAFSKRDMCMEVNGVTENIFQLLSDIF